MNHDDEIHKKKLQQTPNHKLQEWRCDSPFRSTLDEAQARGQ